MTRLMQVSEDKWRDAIKFLMGQGTNPSLTSKDQKKLREFMRGPFAKGMTEREAIVMLRNGMGWTNNAIAYPSGTQLTGAGRAMLANDERSGFKLPYKPTGVHTYPAENNMARINIDLWVDANLAATIIGLIPADVLKANGR